MWPGKAGSTAPWVEVTSSSLHFFFYLENFMKALFSAVALAAFALSSGAAFADADAALNKGGCMACHAKDKKIVGPAFKDIAAKYKGQDVAAKLFEKVRKGGSGVYGPVPMSPNGPDKIGDAELKEAIAAILKS